LSCTFKSTYIIIKASLAHKKVKQENKLSPKAKQNLFENVDVGDISETFGIESVTGQR
jgi:hypothetical protein